MACVSDARQAQQSLLAGGKHISHLEAGVGMSTVSAVNCIRYDLDVSSNLVLRFRNAGFLSETQPFSCVLTGLERMTPGAWGRATLEHAMLCRSLAPTNKGYGRGLLGLLLGMWHEGSDSTRCSIQLALTALAAAVPAERRISLAPILTSGLVQPVATLRLDTSVTCVCWVGRKNACQCCAHAQGCLRSMAL